MMEMGARIACECLARSEVPVLPTSMPEQLKDSGAKELEQWIKSYYGAIAFIVCEQQPL